MSSSCLFISGGQEHEEKRQRSLFLDACLFFVEMCCLHAVRQCSGCWPSSHVAVWPSLTGSTLCLDYLAELSWWNGNLEVFLFLWISLSPTILFMFWKTVTQLPQSMGFWFVQLPHSLCYSIYKTDCVLRPSTSFEVGGRYVVFMCVH